MKIKIKSDRVTPSNWYQYMWGPSKVIYMTSANDRYRIIDAIGDWDELRKTYPYAVAVKVDPCEVVIPVITGFIDGVIDE